jgi:hypothetical protein
MKQEAGQVHAGLLFDLYFDLEDGGDLLLRIAHLLPADYTTYPRRQNSSNTHLHDLYITFESRIYFHCCYKI